ncbi:MAG: hypothetical protein HY749_02765 [Gammaproteobacteria bacterium]|nr:hypothetical protein [Gammaproteobacteria bacterium]
MSMNFDEYGRLSRFGRIRTTSVRRSAQSSIGTQPRGPPWIVPPCRERATVMRLRPA